ncbi:MULTISPECIES: (Fe-S)-binding protein [unclassified Apibacter]|uniref:(Fe-S)-binding protein n=1 Tax=unclassified Apibacter TaxID=2630820 RepID=UPI00135DECAF|nr:MULTISPECIES: (Fe-S)-binding protein [unclassified Apibacter]MXP06208.1 4Fe-4S dicluster domain-containing protein [Apibacter sp. B3546]MXP12207.1 4Fe-4S dicluster domain-containing protein [Apibacter sp. B3239]
MDYIQSIIFLLLAFAGIGLFVRNILKIKRNILLGKAENRSDNPSKRWKLVLRIAIGQGKILARPVAGILHLVVYIGFVIINIELIEIFVDGIWGTHRYFGKILPSPLYNLTTGTVDILSFSVLIAVTLFFIRRNIIKVPRLNSKDLLGWPHMDGNLILIIEFLMMLSLLIMNAADFTLQKKGILYSCGFFPISNFIFNNVFSTFSVESLYIMQKSAWWFHYLGVLFFLNYLYFSKHLHILFAFPNTYFANLQKQGQLNDLDSVTKEVKLLLDPNADPYHASTEESLPEKFGVSDATDLSWIQLLNAYTCTECGRCTSSCPANLTGKKLSPRKIMMDVRDRIEEIGRNIDKNGNFLDDGKQLLGNYITPEEIWACTTCNACVEACPLLINPLSILIDLRRYLVMEKTAAPSELNSMMSNIENNNAPWQFSQNDRANWTKE